MELFEEWGCRLKVERGNRVFPVSDKSSDVIAAIAGAIRKAGVEIHLNEEVSSLELRGGRCVGVRMKGQKRPVEADAVIVTTGGLSYPTTGSTGDGYRFAAEPDIPSRTAGRPWCRSRSKDDAKELQGLALHNIEATVYNGKKVLYEEFGEMLFTHFGVSGPVLFKCQQLRGEALKKGPLPFPST